MVQKKKPIKDVLMVFLNTKRILSAETIKPRNSNQNGFQCGSSEFWAWGFLGTLLVKNFSAYDKAG